MIFEVYTWSYVIIRGRQHYRDHVNLHVTFGRVKVDINIIMLTYT